MSLYLLSKSNMARSGLRSARRERFRTTYSARVTCSIPILLTFAP
jgi:hypothetical protein